MGGYLIRLYFDPDEAIWRRNNARRLYLFHSWIKKRTSLNNRSYKEISSQRPCSSVEISSQGCRKEKIIYIKMFDSITFYDRIHCNQSHFNAHIYRFFYTSSAEISLNFLRRIKMAVLQQNEEKTLSFSSIPIVTSCKYIHLNIPKSSEQNILYGHSLYFLCIVSVKMWFFFPVPFSPQLFRKSRNILYHSEKKGRIGHKIW